MIVLGCSLYRVIDHRFMLCQFWFGLNCVLSRSIDGVVNLCPCRSTAHMSVRKEPSSLGRIQGRSLTRDNSISHDSLSSHPLLSPLDSLSSNATPSPNTASSANTTSVPPKYVPYTPRHRVTTSSVTIAPQAPPSLSTTGPATPQLQIQNLKAAAQNAQLSLGSIGWAICEKLYAEGEGAEWEELWNAIANNKVKILPY